MQSFLYSKVLTLYQTKVPATGVGLFRILFGLVTLQEIFFLIFFNHLIFDPIPFLDVEFPMIGFFLVLWAVIALCLLIGYQCQFVSLANYLFWLVFVNFTPMQRDFDGGFDLFMIGANAFLIFMPIDRAFSIDSLRHQLAQPFHDWNESERKSVSVLAYLLPVTVCLGFLYLDSVIHKLFAEHWRNGLGPWLPSSIPYYISALDLQWLLDNEPFQRFMGYLILFFQVTFLPFFTFKTFRPFFFWVGMALHLGITLSFNIYPFGLGMLSFYSLVIPLAWYARIGHLLKCNKPLITVFYDQMCPLCRRTVLIIRHFDVFNAIGFKTAQVDASNYAELKQIPKELLLKDLFAITKTGKVVQGVDTYISIAIAMRYLAPVGWLLKMPILHSFARMIYRNIADSRVRVTCDSECHVSIIDSGSPLFYDKIFENADERNIKKVSRKISRLMVLLLVLQMNSSLHYGILYRLNVNTRIQPIASMLTDMSNSILMFSTAFFGITPHALYLHDHFEGYDHILAITYREGDGQEKWLPFIDESGRMLAPNWGRVHSMWANIAVTPNIDEFRLKKLMMKVIAFWGRKEGLDFNNTTFYLKLKHIRAPFQWEKGLRNENLSGNWETIGNAQWKGKELNFSLPEDIDKL
jgi:predicted DCC family thiol-disulfide oxidoreductase YuxK